MAQLSDDCFAFGGALLGVDAALALIAERIAPVVDEEGVPLSQAAGRILARDIVAQIDVPPHANSAVDGIVVTDQAGRVVYANSAYLTLVDAVDADDVRPVERVFVGDPLVSEAIATTCGSSG